MNGWLDTPNAICAAMVICDFSGVIKSGDTGGNNDDTWSECSMSECEYSVIGSGVAQDYVLRIADRLSKFKINKMS